MSERNLYESRLPSDLMQNLRREGYYSVYNIRIMAPSDDYYIAVDEWCENNCNGKFLVTGAESLFEYKEDMVKFGLTWL